MSEDRNKHDRIRGGKSQASGYKVGKGMRADGKGRELAKKADPIIGRPPKGFIERIFGK